MRRMLTGGVSAFAVLSLALAGCSGSETATPAKSPEAQKVDVATLLPQSLKKIQNESFKFSATITMDELEITTSGAFDMTRKLGTVSMQMDAGGKDMKLEMRVLGTDMYMSGLMTPGQWIRVDMTKFPAGNMFGEAANPVSNADYLLAISDAKEVGEGRYQGTLDLQKYLDEYAKPEQAKKLKEGLGTLGPDALKVPFEATVDDQNRLTTMKITMTMEAEGEKVTMVQDAKYFDFGTKVDVAKPPADKVTDAPAGIYGN